MANGVRINNLNQSTSLNDTDTITIIQDDENKKASISLLDKDGTYMQSVVNTIPDLIATSKSNIETTKQAINEKLGEDEFSAQINTVKEMSSIGISDDGFVDVSSQVQDGFMETAILYGKTLVNNVTTDTSQDDYVAFDKDYSGQNFSIDGTVEGYIKSAILSGNTLVNLVGEKREYVNIPGKTLYGWEFMLPYNLTSGKTYLAIFDVSGTIDESNSKVYLMDNGFNSTSGNTSSTVPIFSLGHNVVKCIATNDIHKVLRIRTTYNENEKFTVSNVMLIEYQEGMENWDVPYFEGIQSVKMPVLTTTGKNLATVSNIRLEGIRHNSGTHPKNIIMKNIPVEEGKTYTISGVGSKSDNMSGISFTRYEHQNPTNSNNHSQLWDEIGRDDENTTFTIPKGIKYVSFTFGNYVHNNNRKDGWMQWDNIQLEEGSTATPYEPYKSNILTVNEDVELRGIGDVKDELDCLTGEVVERVGEYQITGEENWNLLPGTRRLQIQNPKFIPNIKSGAFACDKLQARQGNHNSLHAVSDETYYIGYTSDNWLRIILGKDLTSLEQGKEWLKANKPIIQYQLKTESIKTVDLTTIDQDGHITNNIHTFNETTHVNTSSQGLIPEISISKSVSYDALINPSTQYTIDLKRNDKNMTVNVGGSEVVFASGETRKTITTPSTLTNNTLSYYGLGTKANSIMLLEGNETRDLDYFTGMKSVKYTTHEDGSKMPILITSNEDGSKTSILSTENDLIMRSNGSTRDSLDLITGKFTQRIGEDGNILDTPIETTININSNLGDEKLPIIYKGGHILLQSDELTPELQYSIPISYSGLIAQNTMTNLRHSWRLDELELLAYASIVNSQYDSLILVSTAETNDIMVSSDYVPDVSLYNMLKVLVNANALENADEKINVFYLYGKLSDEMYIDLIMGDDM